MIVMFKNKEGTFSIRPAYIGFIKNDYARRTLCTLFFPIIILATLAVNILEAAFVAVVLFVRAFWRSLSGLKPIWKTEIWHRPREKADKESTMM